MIKDASEPFRTQSYLPLVRYTCWSTTEVIGPTGQIPWFLSNSHIHSNLWILTKATMGILCFIILHFLVLHRFLLFSLVYCTNKGFIAILCRANLLELFFQNIFHFECLCHIWQFSQYFKLFLEFLYLSFWSGVSDLWCYYWNHFGVPWTAHLYETGNFFDKCYVCSDCSTDGQFPQLSPSPWSPNSLRQNNVEIGPFNYSIEAAKCSS